MNPWNWAWTVAERCESSTTESIGASDVNSVSNCPRNQHVVASSSEEALTLLVSTALSTEGLNGG